MSQSAVVSAVQAHVQALDNGTMRCELGMPHAGLPPVLAGFPLAVLTIRNLEGEHATFGAGGLVWERYAVIITLYLAPKDADHSVAFARSLGYASQMRAQFAPDWKLGGNCFNSDLRGPADNLGLQPSGGAMYQDASQYPMLQWALMVTEQAAANDAAL